MNDRQPNALVVSGFDTTQPLERSVEEAIRIGLEQNHRTEVVNLTEIGWKSAMSLAERRAYHTSQPAIDPMVCEHIEKVKNSQTLIFGFPTRHWMPVPIMKGWFDRVMIPGVAFTFDEQNKLQPNLALAAIGGVSIYDMSQRRVNRVIDGGRRIVLRSLRANVDRRPQRVWAGLYPPALHSPGKVDAFLHIVHRKMSQLGRS